MSPPEILDIVPEHVADPVRRAPWPARLGTALGDGLLSALLNAAVVGWLIGIGWPRPPARAPEAISVDLVDHMPGDKPDSAEAAGKAGGASRSDAPKPAGVKNADAARDADRTTTRTEAAPPASPPTPDAAKQPPEAPKPQPNPQPEPQPMPPIADATAPPDAAASHQAAAPTPSPPTPIPPLQSAPAVPAAPDHPDNTSQPQLVEAPHAPRIAATQTETHDAPVVTPETKAAPTPGPPPAQPKVVTAPADDAVAPPAPPPPKTPAQRAEEQRQAAATATLAAVLPFGSNVASDPFQAAASAQGQALNESYRGAVYDNFNTRAADVQEEARVHHLKGTAVVAFSVDADGNLASSHVALSSGQPEVDRMALEMIRRAAPFPPPPAGAQRSFSTALSFGSGD